jgi:hypothetical protein
LCPFCHVDEAELITISQYLGPTGPQLAHLFILALANSVTLFALGVLLIRSLWSLVTNVFTVEGWEIERHETLVRRARVLGGFLEGPDGIRVRIVQQEYPYDIGLWQNVVQGMGTANVLHLIKNNPDVKLLNDYSSYWRGSGRFLHHRRCLARYVLRRMTLRVHTESLTSTKLPY